jgi:hypothetical protein
VTLLKINFIRLSPIVLFEAISLKEVVVSSVQRLFRWPFQMSILDETLPNFIKIKHPRKGEKENKGQVPKSKQANNPKEACHKNIREPLNTENSINQVKHIN